MSSKASSLSSRVRARISQALPDVESLVVGAVGLAQSGSRTEARFWEARLAQALGRLLDGGHAGAVLAALDRINQMDGTAYGALLDSELLAEVYLGLTRGQGTFDIGGGSEEEETGTVADAGGRWPPKGLKVRLAADAERQLHEQGLLALEKQFKSTMRWRGERGGE